MPIYEYRCQACDEEFEIMQKISARPLRKCRSCGGRLEKLLSKTSFVLRGSGWYADGYGGTKKGKKPADGAGKAEKKDAGASKPKSKEASSGGGKSAAGGSD